MLKWLNGEDLKILYANNHISLVEAEARYGARLLFTSAVLTVLILGLVSV